MNGKVNSPFPKRLMDFYCLLESYDRKTFQLIAGNLHGPSLRNVLKHSKKSKNLSTEKAVVDRKKEDAIKILMNHIVHLQPNKDEVVAFSAAIDASKVARVLQINHGFNAVVGGAQPKHFIVGALDEDDTQDGDAHARMAEKLKAILNDKSIALADEVKVLVISFQKSGHKSPYYILLARPQTNNESSRYNEDCAEICLEAAKQLTDSGRKVFFLCCANDGVSCDKDFVVKTIISFMIGAIPYLATTDINQ